MRYNIVCFDMLWYSMLAMVYSGMLQYDRLTCVDIAINIVQYGMVYCGMLWYPLVCNSLVCYAVVHYGIV